MKKIIFIAITFISVFASAQSNFQRKLFHAAPAGSLMEIVYSNEYNTSTFVIKNLYSGAVYNGFAELTKFTTTTGNVTSSKTFSVSGYDLIITDVVKNNQMLYLTARLTNSISTVPCVIKYNLSTNATVWRRVFPSSIFPYNAIAYDTGANLFLLGSYTNSTVSQTDLIVSKMDTNGVLIWTKGFGESTLNNNPGNIIYNGKRQLYVTTVANVGTSAQSIILRLDSSGTILNSRSLTTALIPKFEKNFSAVLKNKLVTIDRTITSAASSPGPFFIRMLDTNLNVIITKTISTSFKVESVFSNNTNLLLSGPTATTTLLKGFRVLRFDTLLNIAGSRHFNKINTVPPGGTSSSFINSTNNSMHFFNPVANDTVFVAKTDLFEAVNCKDSSFVAQPSTLNFAVSVATYSTAILTLTTTSITMPVANTTYTSNSTCTGLTTNLNSISNNDELVSVYPNPANEILNVKLEMINGEEKHIRVINSLGQVLIEQRSLDDNLKFEIGNFQKGIYFISLYNAGGQLIYTKKFIKE